MNKREILEKEKKQERIKELRNQIEENKKKLTNWN